MKNQALQQFKDAVQNENVSRTVETGEDLAEALQARSDSLQATDTAVRTALLQSDPTAQEMTVMNELIDSLRTESNHRAEMGLILLELSRGQFSKEDFLAKANELESVYQTVNSLREDFENSDVASSIKPMTAVTAPDEIRIPKGGQSVNQESYQEGNHNKANGTTKKSKSEEAEESNPALFDIGLQNGGGKTMNDIQLTVETDLDVGLSASVVDSVPGFESKTIQGEIQSLSSPGDYSIRLSADPSNADLDTTIVPVYILGVGDYLEEARTLMNDFESDIEELKSGLQKSIRPLKKNISKYLSKIDSLLEDLEAGRVPDQALPGRLQSLDSELNKFYGLLNSYQSLPPSTEAALVNTLETVSDRLSGGRSAAI